MNQQVKDKLCKQIDTEIEKIANMPSLNDATLANLYKLIDVKKDLLEIEEKEMELGADMYQGNSMRSSYRNMGGNSNRMPARYYDDGYSMNGYGGNSYDHMPDDREMVRQRMMDRNGNIY